LPAAAAEAAPVAADLGGCLFASRPAANCGRNRGGCFTGEAGVWLGKVSETLPPAGSGRVPDGVGRSRPAVVTELCFGGEVVGVAVVDPRAGMPGAQAEQRGCPAAPDIG
jgi:hypothetical protein